MGACAKSATVNNQPQVFHYGRQVVIDVGVGKAEDMKSHPLKVHLPCAILNLSTKV